MIITIATIIGADTAAIEDSITEGIVAATAAIKVLANPDHSKT
jgi:hypothetical protein